jgi:hypothetical protein
MGNSPVWPGEAPGDVPRGEGSASIGEHGDHDETVLVDGAARADEFRAIVASHPEGLTAAVRAGQAVNG